MKKVNKEKIALASAILAKYEDENEYHFFDYDRKFIIQAMFEFAEQITPKEK